MCPWRGLCFFSNSNLFFCFVGTGSYNVTQADLKLTNLLTSWWLDLIANSIQPRITWGKESQRGNHLQWIVLQACLEEMVSIKLTDLGRPSPLWVALFPRLGILNYVRVEKSRWSQASKQVSMRELISFCLDCRCAMTSCLKFLSPLPHNVEFNLDLWAEISPLAT